MLSYTERNVTFKTRWYTVIESVKNDFNKSYTYQVVYVIKLFLLIRGVPFFAC